MTCDYKTCDRPAVTLLTGVRVDDTDTGETMVVCDDHYNETHAVALVEDERDL